ncbi:MAG: DNA-binding response regulator [Planctomycetota bacterium]|nr:MAG: DNA-binding response regulator [Planctomycetota bacterium]
MRQFVYDSPAGGRRGIEMTERQLHVCVVEDEERLRKLLVREIGEMNATVVGFETAEEAWTQAQATPFDLAIVDLNLPGEGGMQLFERLHKKSPETAVVILTGYGGLDSAVQALRWGAADYLTKPCTLEQIRTVVERVRSRQAAPGGTLEELEREQILATLRANGGNKPKTAEALGISLRTLYNKLHAYKAQGYWK